ncbi:outer membrane beta-barrel protein [Acidobacteriota bacterium]
MVKRTFLTFFLVCLMLANQNVSGQEKTGMRIHCSLGLSSMSEKKNDSGLWSGFGFSLPIHKTVDLSFNFGAWKSQVNANPHGLFDGSLKVNPFFVSLYYFMGKGDRSVIPYVFIGGGYIFSNFRKDEGVTIPESTISQKIDNSPGGQVGAGIKFKVSNRMSLITDVSYLYSKTSASTIIQNLNFGTTREDFSLILSALIFQVGVKFLI